MITWETVDNSIKEKIFSYIKDTAIGLIEISPDEFKRARDTKNKFDETFGNCWEMYVSPTVMNLLEENDIPLDDFDYGEDVETYAGCGPIYDKFQKFFDEFIVVEVKKL